LDRLRELYAEDAIIFNTEPPAQFLDFKTFENTLQQRFSQIREMTLFTSNIRIEVDGDMAWISSQFLRSYRQNGRVVRQSGRWTEVYSKREGEWKLVHFHSSLDPRVEDLGMAEM
jgi:ketosteroid isomerase-like protein